MRILMGKVSFSNLNTLTKYLNLSLSMSNVMIDLTPYAYY